VVSVDEGVLKESLRKVIEELAIHDKPMMLVITKCDKKRPEDVEAVVSHVQAQIEKLAKKPLLAVCRTQRRNATEWATALPVLLPLQQQFWHQAIGLPVQKCINDILIRIEQLSQGHNQTLEEIESGESYLPNSTNACRKTFSKSPPACMSNAIWPNALLWMILPAA
jgi:GTPase SAR1 family protein